VLVRLADVSKTYFMGGVGDGGDDSRVLRDVTLDLKQGETNSLIGASGCGKSTLLGLIGGLVTPDEGHLHFDGEDLAGLDDRARAQLRTQRIGIVLQRGNLVPFLRAGENVEFAMEIAGRGRQPARARDLLDEFGVGHRARHLPRQLSGGEAQRVAIAMAMANDPDLLLADEVTGELDSASAERVMGVIFDASVAYGLTVLFVTHNTELAARAQRQWRIADGRVLPVSSEATS